VRYLEDGRVLDRIPKVELHYHVDGSVRPETILELALKENIKLQETELYKFKAYVQVSKECTSLKEYLQKFDLTLAIMQREDNIKRIVIELLEDLAFQNVKYVELRCSPFLFMKGGLSFEQVVESILSGMMEGRQKFNIKSNLILICMRHHSPKESIEVVEKGRKYLGKGVVAVDLAGNEADFPPELHKEAFKLAKEYGYHITVHAGEVAAPKNVITAIKDLYAERIGHGVYAEKDEEAYRLLKECGTAVEMCLTSNVQTHGVEDIKMHPVKSYFEKGIKVTINTDNTTVSNTDLKKEYEILIKEFGFSMKDIKAVIMNAVNAAFLREDEKVQLAAECEEGFKLLNI
jgi:adenosine deaminase